MLLRFVHTSGSKPSFQSMTYCSNIVYIAIMIHGTDWHLTYSFININDNIQTSFGKLNKSCQCNFCVDSHAQYLENNMIAVLTGLWWANYRLLNFLTNQIIWDICRHTLSYIRSSFKPYSYFPVVYYDNTMEFQLRHQMGRFYLWLNKIPSNQKSLYIYNAFSHCLRPYPDI